MTPLEKLVTRKFAAALCAIALLCGAAHAQTVATMQALGTMQAERNDQRDLPDERADEFVFHRDGAKRIVVQVFINDKGPFDFLLDTGANQSAIGRKLATRLALSMGESTTKLQGVTGEMIVPRVKVAKLQAGSLILADRWLPIVDATLGGLDGVLGVDGFRNKRVAAHIVGNSVSIERSSRKTAAPEFATFPLEFRHGLLVIVPATVPGTSIKAVIDTGSEGSLGNERLRFALATRMQSETLPTIAHVQGVTGTVQRGQWKITSLIRLERAQPDRYDVIQIDDMPIAYGDFYVFELWKLTHEPALLVGMDILSNMEEVIIDYGRKELQLKARTVL